MGTLGDLLVLGEGPSIVADADVDLLGRACELLWSRAVVATGPGPHVIKLSVTTAVVRGLRLSMRREMCRLASSHGDRGTGLGGSDLFYLAVNHYLHAEKGREFRLPLGELPIVRRNQRGGVVARPPIGLGSLHSQPWVHSLMLCLISLAGVGQMCSWTPLYVSHALVMRAMHEKHASS